MSECEQEWPPVTPKQPQPAPKREEKKRLPIVLGDATPPP